jgi:nucleoside-diphosphate-sugar epimerase
MKKMTVYGAGGFIGSKVCQLASHYGFKAVRGDWQGIKKGDNLGDVVFASGVGDIAKPNDMLDSHLKLLREIVQKTNFNKITYISSTRVYLGANSGSESSPVSVLPTDARAYFNLLKLTAEKYLQLSGVNHAVIRPSNVYGLALNSPLFLPSIVRDSILKGEVNMHVDPDYSKDYVFVDDVAHAILQATKSSFNGIANVASGENISAKEIADALKKYTGCKINWHQNECDDHYPVIDVSILKNDFSIEPRTLDLSLREMILKMKESLEQQ